MERLAELEGKQGKRFELWVTAVGQLRTMVQRSPLGPCDRIGSHSYGYGHLGACPAQLVVREFRDIEIRANPNSPYDYSKLSKGQF
jgi:hypothetical protein